jgi:hypothetical protein
VGREKTKAQTSGVKRGLGNNCKKIIIKKRGNNNKKTLKRYLCQSDRNDRKFT